MVLALEPSLVLPALDGVMRRLMVHEEHVVVTASGCGLLSRPAAATLPVV